MQDIDTKVDFARSLAVFSILLLVLAPLAGLYEWRRSKTTLSGKCSIAWSCFCFWHSLVKFAYESEAKQYDQRAFGYFATLQETETKNVARPRNIGDLKAALRHYHDNEYPNDLTEAASRAEAFLPAACGKNEAVVLDVDETVLSNWQILKTDDFGYSPQRWNAYVEEGNSPAIPGMPSFYNEAIARGCAVFFITMRPESERSVTEHNLGKYYTKWQQLIMKPDGAANLSAAVFKSTQRGELVRKGWRILLNVSDQPSDLLGGFADHRVLLPNPFYTIR
jgi:acid phosphatase